MKNKKTIMTICGIAIIGLLIFFLMGFMRGNSPMMTAPVKITYPQLEETATYIERIFDTNSMHEINIQISKKDWEDLIKNAALKKKYKVDVIIDGIRISNVSVKTKGNRSLNNILSGPSEGPASKRFSFKINFNDYEKNQTYYGLDILHLNNLYGDATYINDFISYESFREFGVAAPLTSFAYVKINGNNFGLYSAIEGVGEAFMKRNKLSGLVYKPEHQNGTDLGASLTYTDDKISSYSNVFNGAESVITAKDKTRFINSIKQLNLQQDLKSVVDTNEIIKYFTVHNFLLSYDSYTGKSIHNYYLLENNGIFSMIPWDYNLAFGRFNMWEDINTIVNYGIDSPLNQVTDQKRPMWEWIDQNKEYQELYHKQMNVFLTSFLESNKLEKLIDSTYEVIKPYVALDVSAFYTPQQVETAISTLKTFCQYRAKSIRLQLDGKLSTVTATQSPDMQIDASSINLNNMGLVADDRLRDAQRNGTVPPNMPMPGEAPNTKK